MTEHSTFQAIAFAAILVVSTLGGATMAVAAQDSTPDGPAVETKGTVTIDSYNVTWDPVSYENNNGDVESLEAHVNDSADNPWAYTPTSAFAHLSIVVSEEVKPGTWAVEEPTGKRSE